MKNKAEPNRPSPAADQIPASAAEWQAIQRNDSSYDGHFWYAVRSTHIFCRPSCPSRLPARENVVIYHDQNAALKAGFRPCKRCRPLNEPVTNQEWVAEIETILTTNYQQPLSLTELAYQVHGSSSYLRHVYKAETGLTPQQRLMTIRLERAREELLQSDAAITEIARKVGMDNVSYFIRKFRERYGSAPQQFRKKATRC